MKDEHKRKITPHIDEEAMMNLMADGVKKEGLKFPSEAVEEQIAKSDERPKEKSIVKEKSKVKGLHEIDYESIFFKKSDTNARDGKTVYIRPEFHEKLTRIIQVIGEDKIPIYAYLDNLLDHHFQEFGEQITKSYNNKYKPI